MFLAAEAFGDSREGALFRVAHLSVEHSLAVPAGNRSGQTKKMLRPSVAEARDAEVQDVTAQIENLTPVVGSGGGH